MKLQEADSRAAELNENYTAFCPEINGECRRDCVDFVKADSIIVTAGQHGMSGGFATGKYYPADYGVSKPCCKRA